jgi:hypothetical protein
MTAYNIVRMRVKPGRDEEFLKKNREVDRKAMNGFRKLTVVKPAIGATASSASGRASTRLSRHDRQ